MRAGIVRTALVALVSAAVAVGSSLAPSTAQAAAPRLTITPVVEDLSLPWDVTWVGSLLLFDQRAGGVWSKRGSAKPRPVSLPLPKIFAQGESGMLGMVADPKASTNRYFYTCMAVATSNGSAKDVEVWKWRLTSDTTATKVKVLVSGIPLTSGRHSGCRLRFRSATMLYIGTGDAAVGTNPQNLKSLGGKVLRIRSDGSIPRTNPFYAKGGNARYVWTYGHRNVQGLTFRAEQRPAVDGRARTEPGRRGESHPEGPQLRLVADGWQVQREPPDDGQEALPQGVQRQVEVRLAHGGHQWGDLRHRVGVAVLERQAHSWPSSRARA